MPLEEAEIWKVFEEADCLADKATVEQALDRMATDMTARLAHENPLVCPVMNGGIVVAGQLLPRLLFPLELSYLHVSRYGDATRGNQVDWLTTPTQNVQGRCVLLLDDILDEGYTLDAVVERLRTQGARQILTGVLVHKLHDRKARPGMRADFTGLEAEDRFLFGYGMDYRGLWRNAPGIYAVRGH